MVYVIFTAIAKQVRLNINGNLVTSSVNIGHTASVNIRTVKGIIYSQGSTVN
ncbi:MAG: hypothetical protein R3C44_23995 [Chloroflexota bacterium]